ncbi:hypothetical protein KQH82_02955 [bacterium]|nr:hypothetical protein [bacterium]
MFTGDGDEDHGISSRGGYFYFIDNESNALLMLDRNLAVTKSWPLGPLGNDTRFQGVTSDGEKLWLSVAGSEDMIYQVDGSQDTLVVTRSFEAPPEARGTIRDLAWGGGALWAVNSGSETFEIPPTLYKLNPTTGAVEAEYPLPGPEPRGMTYVTENANAYGTGSPIGFYIADVDLDSIYSFRTDKMQFGSGFKCPIPPRGESYVFPVGLSWDGADFWMINSSSAGDHLYRLSVDGRELDRVEIPWVTPGPVVWASHDIRAAGPPTVMGVAPNTSMRGSLLTVVVTGSGFRPGASLTVDFGTGIAVTDVLFVDDTRLEVEIQVAGDAEFGARDVTVTNPDGQSAVGAGMFTISNINPLDGYIWLTDPAVDSLYKIRISDTTVVQAWSVLGVAGGGSPQGLAYDGEHMWLCAGGTDDLLIKLNTSGASLGVLHSITAPPNAAGIAREIAFDADGNIWTANSETDYIYQQDTATGAILDSIATPGDEIRGIEWVNGELYSTDRTTDSVYVWNDGLSTWTPVFGTPVPSTGTESNRYATGMCWDGVNFWIVNSTYEFDYYWQVNTEGTVLLEYEVPYRGDAQPSGLEFTQE